MTRIGIAGASGKQGKRWVETVLSCSLDAVPFHRDNMLVQSWDGCDAFIVATPTETHAAHVQAALRAGKPVLCEKPLAPTFQQAGQLYDIAARYWTRLWVCYPHLWHPSVEAMAKLADGIELEVTFCGPTEREPLLDWAPHALSTALYILGNDAQLKSKVVSEDRKRVSVELESARGRAWCLFGWAAVKRVSVQTKNQPRLYYNCENCHPTTMQRMLAAWLRSEDDPRGDPALTLGVHEILEEVLK